MTIRPELGLSCNAWEIVIASWTPDAWLRCRANVHGKPEDDENMERTGGSLLRDLT